MKTDCFVIVLCFVVIECTVYYSGLSVLDGTMNSMMCASDICAKSSGGDSGGSGGDEHKMCTSYEQKNSEHCKDGASDNTSGSSTKTGIKSSSDNVNDIADDVGMVYISKDTGKVVKTISTAEMTEKVQRVIGSADVQHYSAFKALELSDPEMMDDPVSKLLKEEIYKQIDEEEMKDKKLFQDPPPKEDCPICLVPMPFAGELDGRFRFVYKFCCGKRVCTGCIDAAAKEMKKGKMKRCCEFCRAPNPRSGKEEMKRCKKRMKLKDAYAFYELGDHYSTGCWGLPQHLSKAVELWKQGAELGSIHSYCGLGDAYMRGAGVEQDVEKARYHFEIAAMGGHENARHGLGGIEEGLGNAKKGMKHIMFAARCGYDMSMKAIGKAYKMGYVTKDEYAATLRAYKESYDEMESVHRAAAAAAREPTRDPYAMSPEDRAACIAEYKGAFTRSKKKK